MLCLVVLVMVYRGAIPAGFMLAPADATSGQVTMMFCTPGGDMVSMLIDLGDTQERTLPEASSALECPYAAMAGQFLLPDAMLLASAPAPRARPAPFAAYRSAPALPAQRDLRRSGPA